MSAEALLSTPDLQSGFSETSMQEAQRGPENNFHAESNKYGNLGSLTAVSSVLWLYVRRLARFTFLPLLLEHQGMSTAFGY